MESLTSKINFILDITTVV